jgi:dienelactone hydrolase
MRRSALPFAASALAALALACTPALKLARDDSGVVLARHTIQAPDPAARGPHAVRTLVYGSGTDKQRAAYRDSVTVKTGRVDASKFVSLGTSAKSRKKYWGFGPDSFPLNARVWYPEGEGRFPLVLVVHGNHDMKDFSDPGYQYLGELLASRGYIVASVDMNFLNGAIRGENDARGWMLLQHVKAWHGFDTTATHPLRRKVDLQNVALIGHSRGGEAVGHAAAFNRMERYPDDANVKLGFDYGIRALVAIAPVDGQYRPAERLVPLENVSYLVFHGSHDGDVSTFHGLRQFQRVRFTDGGPHFKSAVYVYRANHGQWNSRWGNRDNGPRSARRLDLRGLLPPEEQRRFAEVYVSAFLDATLKGKREYLPLFRDHRVAGEWLPKTMYVTRFEQSGYRALADFEEDVDVSTGSVAGVRVVGDSLATWKEARVPFRSQGTETQDNSAVWLGWNNRVAGADTARRGRPASLTVTLPDTLATAWGVTRDAVLSLQLTATDATPAARTAPRATTRKADSAKAPAPKPTPRPAATKDTTPPPIDLTIEVVDAAGATARLPLGRYGAIRRPLETYILRRRDRERRQFANLHEIVLQSYHLPLADFVAAEPRLDPTRLRQVRLVFDRADAGTVIVDEIGVTTRAP